MSALAHSAFSSSSKYLGSNSQPLQADLLTICHLDGPHTTGPKPQLAKQTIWDNCLPYRRNNTSYCFITRASNYAKWLVLQVAVSPQIYVDQLSGRLSIRRLAMAVSSTPSISTKTRKPSAPEPTFRSANLFLKQALLNKDSIHVNKGSRLAN